MKRRLKYKKIFYICFLTSVLIMGSTISFDLLTRKVVKYSNPNSTKIITVVSDIEKFDTEYVYDPNMPSSADPVIITQGANGIKNKTTGEIEKESVTQIVKVGTGEKAIYTGRMTGYGGDCKGCSGSLSCKTKEGTKFNLKSQGHIYNDEVYGEVRILAADLSLFPCGTVIKVDNGKLEPFYAVVLDTGYTMRKAWSQGTVWLDLAYTTQNDKSIYNATSRSTTYSVQRWGW